MPRLVPAVSRSVAILSLFVDGHEALSVPEISQLLGLPKSSCHELVQTLVEHRLLSPTRHDAYRFGLGMMTFELGSAYAKTLDAWGEASETARRVGLETRETVQIGILDGADVLYLVKVDSPHPVRLVSEVGVRIPAHLTAGGKAMLATFAASEVEARLGSGSLEVMTPNSVGTMAELHRELQRTRERGYAEDNCESNVSVCCIAASFYNSIDQSVAALSVSVPTTRVGPDWPGPLVEIVTSAAAELSQRLVHTPRPTAPANEDREPAPARTGLARSTG